MKIKDLDISLAVKDGVVDLDLKTPGVKAVVTFDSEVYSKWARPEAEAAPADGCSPPVDKGLGTSPSLTMGEWSKLIAYVAQGFAHIVHERQAATGEADDGGGEADAPVSASLSEEEMAAAAAAVAGVRARATGIKVD